MCLFQKYKDYTYIYFQFPSRNLIPNNNSVEYVITKYQFQRKNKKVDLLGIGKKKLSFFSQLLVCRNFFNYQ